MIAKANIKMSHLIVNNSNSIKVVLRSNLIQGDQLDDASTIAKGNPSAKQDPMAQRS